MRTILASTVVVAGAMIAAPTLAQTTLLTDDAPGWRYSVTVQSFLPVSSTGTSAVAGASADVDLDLKDIFESLNFAASGRGEAWNGDFGLILDFYHVDLGGGASAVGPGPFGVGVDASIDLQQTWLALIGAYRFADGTWGTEGRRYAFDAGAGIRYNILDQTVDLRVSGPRGATIERRLGGTETFIEPTLTLRGTVELTDRWSLGARGEIGGFGAGGDDLQWLAVTGFDYRPWEQTSLRFGWQVYGIDFSTERSDGAFVYDVVQTGPYLALSYRF